MPAVLGGKEGDGDVSQNHQLRLARREIRELYTTIRAMRRTINYQDRTIRGLERMQAAESALRYQRDVAVRSAN